ncbi:hypothetical protein [Nocardia brevicatena]|uniref:hypothetical protein n=1 Tax=Nocardia brevicatena TaxID=37327 RepID=UPI00059354F5|nr:hypothetical protein [Nocardia brevicatena]
MPSRTPARPIFRHATTAAVALTSTVGSTTCGFEDEGSGDENTSPTSADVSAADDEYGGIGDSDHAADRDDDHDTQ